MEKRKVKCGGYGMFTGIYGIVGLGILFGILLGIPFKPDEWTLSDLAAVLATGMALAYVMRAAIDWIAQTIALATQGNRQRKYLGNALDREGFLGIAGAQHRAIGQAHRDAKVARVDGGQFGNVTGHLTPLAGLPE